MRTLDCMLVAMVGLATVHQARAQLCLADDIQKDTEFKYKSRNLYKGLTIFTANFLDAMNKANPNENLFFSPFSLYHALLLAYFGSANQTEKGLKVSTTRAGFPLFFCLTSYRASGRSATSLGQRQVRCLQGLPVRETLPRALRGQRFGRVLVGRSILL